MSVDNTFGSENACSLTDANISSSFRLTSIEETRNLSISTNSKHESLKEPPKVSFPDIHRSSTPRQDEDKNHDEGTLSRRMIRGETNRRKYSKETNKLSHRRKMTLPQVSVGQQKLISQIEHEEVCCNKRNRAAIVASSRSLSCDVENSVDKKDSGYDNLNGMENDSLCALVVSGKSLKF